MFRIAIAIATSILTLAGALPSKSAFAQAECANLSGVNASICYGNYQMRAQRRAVEIERSMMSPRQEQIASGVSQIYREHLARTGDVLNVDRNTAKQIAPTLNIQNEEEFNYMVYWMRREAQAAQAGVNLNQMARDLPGQLDELMRGALCPPGQTC